MTPGKHMSHLTSVLCNVYAIILKLLFSKISNQGSAQKYLKVVKMSMPYVRICVMGGKYCIFKKCTLCLNPKHSEWSTVNHVADARKFHGIQDSFSVDPVIFHFRVFHFPI